MTADEGLANTLQTACWSGLEYLRGSRSHQLQKSCACWATTSCAATRSTRASTRRPKLPQHEQRLQNLSKACNNISSAERLWSAK